MRTALSIFLASILLVGCGGEEFQDLRDFVKNAGADMRGKVEPPPDIKPYEPFTYDNDANLPDPFKPRKPDARNANQIGQNQPNLNRPKEELEDFPLESLKMVGYLFQKGVGQCSNTFCRRQNLSHQSGKLHWPEFRAGHFGDRN